MVLEPLFPPRVGQALNLLAGIACAAIAITPSVVMSVEGQASFLVVGSLLALGFAARFVGVTYAQSQGQWAMPWSARAVSWLFFGAVATLIALLGAPRVMVAFGAFVALDAATGLVKRDVKPREKKSRAGLWARAKVPLLVALYLAFVAIVHVTVSRYLSYGVLVTWTLLGLGFSVMVRASLVGPKAAEAELHAPLDHRKHVRRVEPVPDPHRQRAEQVLMALKARGDAGAFLDFVRDSARDAGLATDETARLEQRILASFARAGTRREQDLDAALSEVERVLSLKERPSA